MADIAKVFGAFTTFTGFYTLFNQDVSYVPCIVFAVLFVITYEGE